MRPQSAISTESSSKNLQIFVERLKKSRKALQITQIELSKKLGGADGMIGNYESGRSFPHIEQLPMIARELGVTQGYLLGDDVYFGSEMPETQNAQKVVYLLNQMEGMIALAKDALTVKPPIEMGPAGPTPSEFSKKERHD